MPKKMTSVERYQAYLEQYGFSGESARRFAQLVFQLHREFWKLSFSQQSYFVSVLFIEILDDYAAINGLRVFKPEHLVREKKTFDDALREFLNSHR